MTNIHQMLPSYSHGDAIGNCVKEMQILLRQWGYGSEVFCNHVLGDMECRNYHDYVYEDPDSWVIYHYSTGSPVNMFALEKAKNIIIMYHNVTPAHFFEGYDSRAERDCRAGREFLKNFSGRVRHAMAVSPYNAEELESLDIGPIDIVPCITDPAKLKPTGAVVTKLFDDDKKNILFVGRISPNKSYEEMLKVFYFYRKYVETKSRLIFVGGYKPDGLYYSHLVSIVKELKIPDVRFAGFVPDEQMGDYYSNASAFLCMSRHEGFCIPLLEAMHFQVPIVARAGTAITHTMGDSGLLFNGDTGPHEVAELLGAVTSDKALRTSMIESQSRQLTRFTKENMAKQFKQVIDSLGI